MLHRALVLELRNQGLLLHSGFVLFIFVLAVVEPFIIAQNLICYYVKNLL